MTTRPHAHTQADVCTCPTDTLYASADVCDFCRQVAFYDDPQYAEMMGFTLVGDAWVLA